MSQTGSEGYTVEPYPTMRRFSIDSGWLGRRRHMMHGLLELDVTRARQYIREHKARTGESLSFTAYIIACLAKAAEGNPHVHAFRTWRNQLLMFDDIKVNTMIEVGSEVGAVPVPHVVEAANRKTFRQIHDEIRAAQARPIGTQEMQFMRSFLILPGFIRHLFYWFATRAPQLTRKYSSSILVSAVGMMFGSGPGWGIPMANFTLTATLGSIVQRPGVVEGRIEVREVLCITLSFDHDIIDGAPAARFTRQFRELVESGYGLSEQ